MKILMLTDIMDIGGAETHVYELSHSLSSMGHEVLVLSANGATAKRLSSVGAGFVETDSFVKSPFFPARAAATICRALRQFKPHVVHAHTRRTLLASNLALSLMPFPLVFTAHAKFSHKSIKRIFTRPPRNTIAVSEDIKRHFSAFFGAKEIFVIENGIDVSRFAPSTAPSTPLHILNVSRLDKDSSKTAELLCRIAPQISANFKNSKITIVGGGSDFGKISAIADVQNKAIGRKMIECVGAQSDVIGFLRKCNIFVGVSRAALEAMCLGITTVICGNEGYFGLCDKENFALCARENFCARGYPHAKAEILLNALKAAANLPDTGKALLGLVTSLYNSERMALLTLKVYKKAITEHRQSLKYDAVICGYYGFGNRGDELVSAVIRSQIGESRMAVIGAKGGGRIWRFNPVAVTRAIRSSHLLVFGGGSLLQNATSRRSLGYYLSILKIASFLGKKIMLYANGFGPIRGEKDVKKCRYALSSVDTASFRDSASLGDASALLGKSAKSYLTCDPVLLLRSEKKEHQDYIAIFIRGKDLTPSVTAQIIRGLSLFLKRAPTKIILGVMNDKEDTDAAKRLCAHLPPKVELKQFSSNKELIDFIASSKLIISSRLHALILSACAYRPFIALCSDPKLTAFAKECDIPDPMSIPINSGDLDKRLFFAAEFAAGNSNEISKNLKNKVEALRKRAKKDIEELKKHLAPF